jgi:hypothetical protein
VSEDRFRLSSKRTRAKRGTCLHSGQAVTPAPPVEGGECPGETWQPQSWQGKASAARVKRWRPPGMLTCPTGPPRAGRISNHNSGGCAGPALPALLALSAGEGTASEGTATEASAAQGDKPYGSRLPGTVAPQNLRRLCGPVVVVDPDSVEV